MTQSNPNKRLLVTVIVLAAVAVAAVYAWRWSTPRQARLQGTILSIDPTARTGVLSFIHPRSGKRFELQGSLPAACEITRGGKPISISELAPGDAVEAEGLLYRTGRVVATRISVLSATAASHPAAATPTLSTRPAAEPAHAQPGAPLPSQESAAGPPSTRPAETEQDSP